MLLAAGLLFHNSRGTTFFADEWNIYVLPLSLDITSSRRNGHLFVVPTLAYNTFFELFGADSYVPFRLMMVSVQLIIAGMLYH